MTRLKRTFEIKVGRGPDGPRPELHIGGLDGAQYGLTRDELRALASQAAAALAALDGSRSPVEEAYRQGALQVTREWAYVFAALATSVTESLEIVKEIELKAKTGHPFYWGQMSLLQTLRQMVDNDRRRYGDASEEMPQ